MATWHEDREEDKKKKTEDDFEVLWSQDLNKPKKKKKWDEQCFEKEAEEYSWIKSWKIIARLWGRVLQDL